MSGLTINALCAGYGKRRIIEHLSISTLPRGEVTTSIACPAVRSSWWGLHSRLFAAPHYYCWMNH